MAQHADTAVLTNYQTMGVPTGTTLLDQFQPPYLGMAHPLTQPLAVGGYEVPGKQWWRRPDEAQLAEEGRAVLTDPIFKDQEQLPATEVKLFDIT